MRKTEGRFISLEACIVSLFPCLLLLDVGANFCCDWFNHLWMISYVGAYFREHFGFPVVFNTNEYVGIPFPIFYGFGFFRLLGLFSGFLSPNLVVRIFAFLFFFVQHLLVLRTCLKLSFPRWFSSSVALIVTLSVYPLTNLYNRGAITEVFATLALTISTCLVFLILLEKEFYKRLTLSFIFVMFFTFSCLTHPTTALYGVFFFCLFFLPFLFLIWKNLQRKMELVGIGLLSVIFVSLISIPWVYITYQFLGKVYISRYVSGVAFYKESLDWFWARISPIPFDRRTFKGISDIAAPFIDAQTNVFLVALWILSYVLNRDLLGKRGLRTGLGHLFVLFTFVLWIVFLRFSVSDEFASRLVSSVLKFIQFAYRFVTYQNLTALCGLLSVGFLIRNNKIFAGRMRLAKGITVVLIGLSINAYIIKMIHGAAVKSPGGRQIWTTTDSCNATLNLTPGFYGLPDYSVSDGVGTIKMSEIQSSNVLRFGPGTSSDFGIVGPLEVDVKKAGWYRTNIQVFPWSRLSQNNHMVQNMELVLDGRSPVFAVFLPEGKSRLSYSFEVSRQWEILNKLSLGTTVILFLAFFGCLLAKSLKNNSIIVGNREACSDGDVGTSITQNSTSLLQ